MPYCSRCKQLVDSWRHDCVPNKDVPNSVPNRQSVGVDSVVVDSRVSVGSVQPCGNQCGDQRRAKPVPKEGDGLVSRTTVWKQSNRERYNAYQREYMRKQRERN